jgi:hypothetical protein
MKPNFEMSMMRGLSFFLGLEVNQSSEGILIHQAKYVREILNKFKMTDCAVSSTPFAAQTSLTPHLGGKSVDQHYYHSMIGSLMYLTASRPNIMFVVCYCARYQANPKESHEIAVKRIFCYLKGTPHLGLWCPRNNDFDLVAYFDSDHGVCKLYRKSIYRGMLAFRKLIGILEVQEVNDSIHLNCRS